MHFNNVRGRLASQATNSFGDARGVSNSDADVQRRDVREKTASWENTTRVKVEMC